MSALTIIIVGTVIAIVPFTLQLDSNLNDVIIWLNNPQNLAQTNYKVKSKQTEQDVKYKEFLKTLIKKAGKILQHEEKNRLDYYNKTIRGPRKQKYRVPYDERESINELNLVQPSWLKSPPIKRKPYYQSHQGHDGNNLYDDDRNNDLTDYSKIYLVLNPEANLEKSDVRDINNMLSSMFSKNSINKKSTMKNGSPRRYKGFVLRDNRRRIRESNEIFAPKESIEHDYKPKRARNEHSRAKARTGVPYIGHRGDVYERN